MPLADLVATQRRLERFVATQEMLFDLSRELRPDLGLQELVEQVLAAMRRLLDFKGGSISLVERGLVRLVASDPPVSQEVLDMRLPVGRGLTGRAIADRRSVYSPDITTDPRVPNRVAKLGSNVTIRSYLAVPLLVHGEAIGGLQVDSAEVDAFSPDDRFVLEGIAAQVATLLEQTRRLGIVSDLERLKDDFMRRVEHELRTPIAVLAGFARLLVEEDLPAEQRRLAAERVDATASTLRYLVEEILALTSLDAGVDQVARDVVAVKDLCDEVLAGRQDPIPVDRDVGDVEVLADPAGLARVVGGLVDNAMRFGAPPVEVVAEPVSFGRAAIEVRDRGPGVMAGRAEEIFQRFTRGTVAAGGLGLGLPTARALVRAMGGELRYVPREGGGAIFRIDLDAPSEDA